MSNTGRTCKVHYTGTFNDGTKFDSSYDRGEPIKFVCGAGQMIPGFDQAVEGMNVGDIIDVHLRPEDAYGMPDPEAIIKAPLADMPGAENLEVGNQVYLANSMGQQFLVKVIEKDDESITFDANHEADAVIIPGHTDIRRAGCQSVFHDLPIIIQSAACL